MPELEPLLAFFKTLADASRLRILGVLAQREATVSELAELLELREATVSHHLTRLRDVGLVTMREDGRRRIHALDVASLSQLRQELLQPDALAEAAAIDPYAWERKVLSTFFDDAGRLTSIPRSRKKRVVVLRRLVERFDGSRRYDELEVNKVIAPVHEDVATLRRELVSYGLLRRRNGVYWRPS